MSMEDQVEKCIKILDKAAKEKEEWRKERMIKDMIEVLRRKRKLYLLPRILKAYQNYLKRKKGILVFAREPDREVLEKIKTTFRDVFRESQMTEMKINKDILGGFIIKTENFLIDASIRGLLQKVEEELTTYN